jgi:hypothetical protein
VRQFELPFVAEKNSYQGTACGDICGREFAETDAASTCIINELHSIFSQGKDAHARGSNGHGLMAQSIDRTVNSTEAAYAIVQDDSCTSLIVHSYQTGVGRIDR